MNPDYTGLFFALGPEIALLVGALLVLGIDLTGFRHQSLNRRRGMAAAVAALSVIVSFGLALNVGSVGPVFNDVLIYDSMAVVTRLGVLILTLLVLGLGTAGPPPRHPAEYTLVVLFAAIGFMLMGAAQQLLIIFVSLELASLSLYVLAGFDRNRPESAEAALKYFLFGGMAAAFLLFGFSLLYGLTGTLDLPGLATTMLFMDYDPLFAVAIVMIVVAFGFKAAAAPFHLWAPDVYQGAPPSAAALIASASKLAAFVLFTRLFWGTPGVNPFLTAIPAWLPVIAVVAGLSLLLGNLVALAQSDLRRLLAYSAIAHAGGLLLGVIAAGSSGPAPLLYYLFTYGIAAAGVFGVIAALESAGGVRQLSDLAGLSQRSPLLAGCLMVFVLSLAGIPPLAGFFGKFVVFTAALGVGGVASPVGWLTLLAIALSAVGLYYYLIILKHALVRAPESNATPVSVPIPAALALLLAAAVTILLGIFPSLLFGLL